MIIGSVCLLLTVCICASNVRAVSIPVPVEEALVERDWKNFLDSLDHYRNVRRIRIKIDTLLSLPDEIGELGRLNEIVFSGTKVFDADRVFSSIAELESVGIVRLDSVNLRAIPSSVGKLQQVKALSFRNMDSLTISSAVSEIDSLEILDLSGSVNFSFFGEGRKEWSILALNLSGTAIDTLPPQLLSARALTFVDFSRNEHLDLPRLVRQLEQYPSLTHLTLSYCGLQELPTAFCALVHLEGINLNHNALRAVPDVVGCLDSLRMLHLSHNRITRIDSVVGSASRLKYLDLCYNDISSASDLYLPESASLHIYLTGNPLDSLELEIMRDKWVHIDFGF